MSEHRGEISIGKDEWLPYFDLEGRYETAVDVDFLIREASEVWTGLETQCVAGCCGIEAFEFWPEDVRKAAAYLDVPSAIQKLAPKVVDREPSGGRISEPQNEQLLRQAAIHTAARPLAQGVSRCVRRLTIGWSSRTLRARLANAKCLCSRLGRSVMRLKLLAVCVMLAGCQTHLQRSFERECLSSSDGVAEAFAPAEAPELFRQLMSAIETADAMRPVLHRPYKQMLFQVGPTKVIVCELGPCLPVRWDFEYRAEGWVLINRPEGMCVVQ